MTKQMDVEQIRELIPHRFPFLFIDRVLDVKPREGLTAIKNVSINEPVFQGHFPSRAIFPGVLMVEAMAQASGVLAYMSADDPAEATKDLYFFAGIDKARFKYPVTPGDQLHISIEFLQEKNNFQVFKTKGIVTVNDELACSANILIMKGRED